MQPPRPNTYAVTLQCNRGNTLTVHLPAYSAEEARQAACNAQLAPLRAVIRTKRKRTP